jgi:hypothetical protein
MGRCDAESLARRAEVSWRPGEIYKAWEKIHQALYEVMKHLPHESLQFLAFRATGPIIRQAAAEVLDWLRNRDVLPDWGWFVRPGLERLRCPT